MKKLIAMVMTAAMVATLVPATAFAADDVKATARIVNNWTKKESFVTGDTNGIVTDSPDSAPELQLKVTSVDSQSTKPTVSYDITVNLDNAKLVDLNGDKVFNQEDIDILNKDNVTIQLAKEGTVDGQAPTYTYKYDKATQADVDAYLEAIYNDMKDNNELDGSVALPSTVLYYSATAPTAQLADKSEKDSFKAYNSKATVFDDVEAPQSIKSQTITGDAVAQAVVKAYATKYMSALQLSGTVDTAVAEAQNQNGVVVEGWKVIDSNSKEAFVQASAVLAWAAADGTYKDYVENGAYKASVDVVSPTFEEYVAGLTLNKFKVGTLYKNEQSSSTESGASGAARKNVTAKITDWAKDDLDEFTITVTCSAGERLQVGDVISVDLLTQVDKAKDATVSATSDNITISNDDEDLTYVAIADEGVSASIKKIATVAEDEHATLDKNLVIKSTVGNFAVGQIIELKLSNGFEFYKVYNNSADYKLTKDDDDLVKLEVLADKDKIEVLAKDIEIEATDAKAGATAVITVKATNKDANDKIKDGAFNARTTVEVMKVVDYTVVLSKDEDKDVPTFYNGVNTDNFGLTDDADHWSVEVTAEETFPGAWSFRKGFNFELPAGVYVADVDVTNVEGFLQSNDKEGAAGVSKAADKEDVMEAFFNAYQDGDHVNFEFDKRVFDDVDSTLAKDEASMSFKLQLVADPGFVGDVTLKLTGELVDEQEIVIAKFVSPFEVTAEQNDLKIDYRYTEIPTTIVVKEAEDGLWDANKAEFGFTVEKPDYIVFEDDPTFTVDEKSGMKLTEDKLKKFGGNDYEGIHFMVDKESAEPATVTISDMSLFMQRSIPAGAYDLIGWTSMWDKYEEQILFAPDCQKEYDGTNATKHDPDTCKDTSIDCIIDDVTDYSDTVKEAFVNVVTAGREQDDASFTTKVVVPVGEKYIIAGEVQYDIDVPAYINANGYTMLPVRAVAVALGINNNNVLWDQATKTVTILYGQRIITMQAGASVVYVNGSAIPASSAVEITDSRTFLGLRDLATALGVTTINWDAATKTASLN